MVQDVNLVRLGSVVRARRLELGLTQSNLGNRVGFYQERISALENGRYGLPSLPSLQQLADALEMDLGALLGAAGFEVRRNGVVAPAVLPSGVPFDFNAEAMRLADQIGELYRQLGDTEAQLAVATTLRKEMRSRRVELARRLERCRQAARPN